MKSAWQSLPEGLCCYSWLLKFTEGKEFPLSCSAGKRKFRRPTSCLSPPSAFPSPQGAGVTCLFCELGERASTQHTVTQCLPLSQNSLSLGLPGSHSGPKQRSLGHHDCLTSDRGPSTCDTPVKVKARFHFGNVGFTWDKGRYGYLSVRQHLPQAHADE